GTRERQGRNHHARLGLCAREAVGSGREYRPLLIHPLTGAADAGGDQLAPARASCGYQYLTWQDWQTVSSVKINSPAAAASRFSAALYIWAAMSGMLFDRARKSSGSAAIAAWMSSREDTPSGSS